MGQRIFCYRLAPSVMLIILCYPNLGIIFRKYLMEGVSETTGLLSVVPARVAMKQLCFVILFHHKQAASAVRPADDIAADEHC